MNVKYSFNWKFFLAFFALIFVSAEIHELVHTNVGYLLGGCYGTRDFNGWQLCSAAAQHPYYWMATLSGPIFTFLMLWLGYVMVKKADENISSKALGLAVLLGSFPFSRIFTVLLRGGDEYLIARNLFNNGEHDLIIWFVTALIIIGICLIPLMLAWKELPVKRRWLTYLILVVGPLPIVLVLLLAILNPLLQSGFLNSSGILGAPLLINVWLALNIGLVVYFRKSLNEWLYRVDI